jgi:hypothetical protein
MTGTSFSGGKSALKRLCSLLVSEWPADRRAWEAACRPGSRLKPGGVARRRRSMPCSTLWATALKDVVLLAASIYLLKQDLVRIVASANATAQPRLLGV